MSSLPVARSMQRRQARDSASNARALVYRPVLSITLLPVLLSGVVAGASVAAGFAAAGAAGPPPPAAAPFFTGVVSTAAGTGHPRVSGAAKRTDPGARVPSPLLPSIRNGVGVVGGGGRPPLHRSRSSKNRIADWCRPASACSRDRNRSRHRSACRSNHGSWRNVHHEGQHDRTWWGTLRIRSIASLVSLFFASRMATRPAASSRARSCS